MTRNDRISALATPSGWLDRPFDFLGFPGVIGDRLIQSKIKRSRKDRVRGTETN